MGQITSGIGLISGIDSASLIEQLLQLDARPQQIVQRHNSILQSQQVAFQDVNAKLLALAMESSTMSKISTFRATTASSSNDDVLTASSSSTSVPSSYLLAVQRLVSSQQTFTKGFSDSNLTPLDAGTISFEFGDARLDTKTLLDNLNGGAGVASGEIRITDRDGTQADIDLSRAETVDDVVEAIMDAPGINVTAEIYGDQLRLIDTSGGAGTLSVKELKGGTTAADLGLTTDLDVDNDILEGSVINGITEDTLLSTLNDGQGIGTVAGLDDLKITLEDGSSAQVDLSDATTVGDVLDAIEAASGNDITATIEGGKGIKLVDNTADLGGAFAVTSLNGSTAAGDLGIEIVDDGDQIISGGRMFAQINSKLASRLNGGSGFAAGSISITNRLGAAPVAVDLSGAVTIQDILDTINDDPAVIAIKVSASLNASGNGIKLTDASGGDGNFVIIEGGSTTAADLGILQDVAADSIDSGNLQYAYVTSSTKLTQLNNGSGVTRGIFKITDSSGASASVDLTQGNEVAIQDVLDEINSKGLKITAAVNTNGDGIILQDTNPSGSPSSAIKVEEVGGSIAKDLGLLGEAANPGDDLDGSYEKSFTINALDAVVDGTLLSALNGGDGVSYVSQTDFTIEARDGTEYDIDLDSSLDTVKKVVDKINAVAGAKVTASINEAGTGLKLVDTFGGGGSLGVSAKNGSSAAEDLGILDVADDDVTINGENLVEVVTLEELASKINTADIGIAASVMSSDGGNTHHLVFNASQTGTKGAFVFDDGAALDFGATTEEAQDALVYYGSSAFKITSSSNTIDLGNGVKVDLKSASDEFVTVTVNQDTSSGSTSIEGFVEKYNSVIDAINKYDTYDAEAEERGLLLGDYTLITLRQRMASMINGSSDDLDGQYNSLQQVGMRIGEGGKLEFDAAKFGAAAESNLDDVIDLFAMRTTTTDSDGKLQLAEHGLGVAISELLDELTDSEYGLLERRMETITSQIEVGEDRIESMGDMINAKRERLQAQFAAMEIALSRIQNQSNSLMSMAANMQQG